MRRGRPCDKKKELCTVHSLTSRAPCTLNAYCCERTGFWEFEWKQTMRSVNPPWVPTTSKFLKNANNHSSHFFVMDHNPIWMHKCPIFWVLREHGTVSLSFLRNFCQAILLAKLLNQPLLKPAPTTGFEAEFLIGTSALLCVKEIIHLKQSHVCAIWAATCSAMWAVGLRQSSEIACVSAVCTVYCLCTILFSRRMSSPSPAAHFAGCVEHRTTYRYRQTVRSWNDRDVGLAWWLNKLLPLGRTG